MGIVLRTLMTGRAISFSVYRDTTVHVRNCMTSPCRAAEHEVRSKRAVACCATVCGDISGLVDLLDMVYMFTKLSDMFGLQEFAEMVQDREGIPPEQSRFVFAGRQLQTDKTLGHYRVRPGSIVYHLIRLRGD